MKTSDVRKIALRIAHDAYENCSGALQYSTFNIDDEARRAGLTAEADAQAIFAYLTSKGVVDSPYLGSGRHVQFTAYGVSVIEHGINAPDHASGPFPPLNVIMGDIGAGAQVAVGSGHFSQVKQELQNQDLVRDLVPLLRSAFSEMQAGNRQKEATLLTAAEDEASTPDSDIGFLKATLTRFAKAISEEAGNLASQALITYCKAQGFIP